MNIVLGGHGATGAHLRARDEHGRTAGSDARRADLVLDACDPARLDTALTGADVVVNAAGIEDPGLVERPAQDPGPRGRPA